MRGQQRLALGANLGSPRRSPLTIPVSIRASRAPGVARVPCLARRAWTQRGVPRCELVSAPRVPDHSLDVAWQASPFRRERTCPRFRQPTTNAVTRSARDKP